MDIDQSGIRLKSNDVLILAPFGVGSPTALIWEVEMAAPHHLPPQLLNPPPLYLLFIPLLWLLFEVFQCWLHLTEFQFPEGELKGQI